MQLGDHAQEEDVAYVIDYILWVNDSIFSSRRRALHALRRAAAAAGREADVAAGAAPVAAVGAGSRTGTSCSGPKERKHSTATGAAARHRERRQQHAELRRAGERAAGPAARAAGDAQEQQASATKGPLVRNGTTIGMLMRQDSKRSDSALLPMKKALNAAAEQPPSSPTTPSILRKISSANAMGAHSGNLSLLHATSASVDQRTYRKRLQTFQSVDVAAADSITGRTSVTMTNGSGKNSLSQLSWQTMDSAEPPPALTMPLGKTSPQRHTTLDSLMNQQSRIRAFSRQGSIRRSFASITSNLSDVFAVDG